MARKAPAEIQTMMDELLRTGVVSGGGRGRRSPLYRWMLSRADDFQRMLDDVHPSWDAVAAVLPQTDEVKDGEGKRPNGERVRKTWYEVRSAKGWAKPLDKSPAPASSPMPKPATDDPPEDEPPPRHTFRPVKLR